MGCEHTGVSTFAYLTVVVLIHFLQRWHDCVRRFIRHGQVLGLKNMYTVAEFPSAWSGRAMPHTQSGEYYLLSESATFELIVVRIRKAPQSTAPV